MVEDRKRREDAGLESGQSKWTVAIILGQSASSRSLISSPTLNYTPPEYTQMPAVKIHCRHFLAEGNLFRNHKQAIKKLNISKPASLKGLGALGT